MITSEERVDKLCDYFDWDKGSEQAMELEKAIDQACVEAVKEAASICDHEGPCDDCIDKFESQGYAKGFSDAIEQAAKVCEESTNPSQSLCNSEHHDPRWCMDCDRMTSMAEVLEQEIKTLCLSEVKE